MKKFLCALLLALLIYPSSILAADKVVLTSRQSFYQQMDASRGGKKTTIYIINKNFDLRGVTVKIPENAVLSFEGGIISNGVLQGNSSFIDAVPIQIFSNVELTGNWVLSCLEAEWFGAKPNKPQYDSAPSINASISSGRTINVPVRLNCGKYYTKNTITLNGAGLVGSGSNQSFICFDRSVDVGIYMRGYFRFIKDIGIHETDTTRTGICLKVGDISDKKSSTRGYIENVEVFGGNIGLDLEYQWCNKISGVLARLNNVGIYAGQVTPYIENAVVEDNYVCGIVADQESVKLYNVVIEGNSVGAYLNSNDVSLINCYFECNQLKRGVKSQLLKEHGINVDGGHLFVGRGKTVVRCLLMGNRIDIYQKQFNNRVLIDDCWLFTGYGNNSLKNVEITKKCKKYIIDEKN